MGAKPTSLKQTKQVRKDTCEAMACIQRKQNVKKKKKWNKQNQYIQTVVLGSAADESL